MASEDRVATTATEGVRVLWEKKFFKTWQKIAAVEAALAERENHFPLTALAKALERAKFLTRRGKAGAYEYIQQYPYVPSADVSAGKKGGKK